MRDSSGHTDTHLRDFQVTLYVPYSAIEEFGYRTEVLLGEGKDRGPCMRQTS